ncbi:MAG: hypothetical protein DRI89_12030 [Bacteroidetes bacterium]|nr:MAG: hypothetical protein DRI89_12030 [Bacteroidota bacterium]
MKNIKNSVVQKRNGKLKKSEVQNLKISKIGIVARDYRELNGNSDFSKNIIEILDYLDSKGCDSVLFSLFTLLENNSLKIETLEKFKNIKTVFVEEFEFKEGERDVSGYKVYNNHENKWRINKFTQKFGTLRYTKGFYKEVINPFIEEVKEDRIMGNCVVLLCGETNIVKYSKKTKKIEDTYDFMKQIPSTTKIILNPIHDKMTRFEMKLKRQFLSMNDRIVVSVWNKGKTFTNGQTRDGVNPPWTVYLNGEEIMINKENIDFQNNNTSKIDVGILDIKENSEKLIND